MKNLVKIRHLIRFDWFMKHMFRDKSDFEILEGFLSELLGQDILIQSILESEANKKDKDDKFNRVDVLVKDTNEQFFIIEIQNNDEYDYLHRILYGTSKTIVENIKKGDPYSTIKKVLSVSILYFDIGQGEDYIYHGTTSFLGVHNNDELKLSEEHQAILGKELPSEIMPEYFLIKAGSFDDDDKKEFKEGLDQWVYFLKTGSVQEKFNAKGLKKAKEKLDVAKLRGKKLASYNRYLHSLHDEASWAFTQEIKQKQREDMENQMKELQERAKNMEKEEKNMEERAKNMEERAKNMEERAKNMEKERKKIQEDLKKIQEDKQKQQEEQKKIQEDLKKIQEDKQKQQQEQKKIDQKIKMLVEKCFSRGFSVEETSEFCGISIEEVTQIQKNK